MSRSLWFLAGAGAGAYGLLRARRVAEAFTPDGLRDRLAGFAVGARLFTDEVRTGMSEKETQLRDRLGLPLTGHGSRPPSGRPPLELTREGVD